MNATEQSRKMKQREISEEMTEQENDGTLRNLVDFTSVISNVSNACVSNNVVVFLSLCPFENRLCRRYPRLESRKVN